MLPTTVKINDLEFVELKDIIYKNSGISFAESKKYLLENRLSKRLAELNFTTFKDYIYYLKYNVNKRAELEKTINLVTINETYFLRERGQMDHLVSTVIPNMIKNGKKNIRIWSVPCSTGEEPYSISILLDEAGLYQKANIEIIATDINSDVVEIAKHGHYRRTSFRGVTDGFYKHFKESEQNHIINDTIKRRIKFNVGNITGNTIAATIGKIDVIFCRNVLIYFDAENKIKAVNMFNNVLNKGGYLYLGHSETLTKISTDFTMENFGKGIVYLKKD